MLPSLIVFGAEYLIWLIAALALGVILAAPPGKRGEALAVLALSLPLAFLLGKAAGLFWFHPLPFVAEGFAPLVSHEPGNAFPSDHAALAGALAAAVLRLSGKSLRAAGAFLLLLGIAVGASRVLAGLHYPVDVAAGLAAGVAGAWIAGALVPKIRALWYA